jgi:hypothetical protein
MAEKVAALEQENQILEEKLKLALFRQFGRAGGRTVCRERAAPII